MMKKWSVTFPDVAPSFLAYGKEHIEQGVELVNKSAAHFLHFDVMDGKFVPPTSFSLEDFKEVVKYSKVINDVHLMVIDPISWAKDFIKYGADIITFHLEAGTDEEIRKTIDFIHSLGKKVGLSIKPKTPVEFLIPYLKDIDLVLLMSVEPGWGGQKFIENSLDRLDSLRLEIDKLPVEERPIIEIDGGINGETGPLAIKHGTDLLVAGSYLFNHDDFFERVEDLKNGKPR